MKRLVYLLLMLCMLVPCLANAELVDDDLFFGEDEFFLSEPEEPVQEPVDEESIIPVVEDMMVIPTDTVNGPDPYRELVLLQPTTLTAVRLSETSVRLAWDPVPFATSYEVRCKVLGESAYTTIKAVPGTQLYFDATVEPGKVVYYRVKAINVSYNPEEVITESPESATVTYISLAKTTVSDPRGMDADSLRLNWTSVEGANGYEVEMSQSSSGGFSVVRTGLTTVHCNVDGLTNGKGYYFRVRAYRTISSGEKYYSDYSSPVKCGTPMDRPSLSVTAGANGAVLSWTASTGAEKYVIYRKAPGSSAYTKLAITADATTSYVDTTVEAGQVYYYFVYGMKKVGVYNCFSFSSVNTAYCAVEGAVINSVENTGELEQTIHWTGPDGAATCKGANKYLVYSSTSEDGLYTQIGETTTETSFVATGLESGKTYYYKVRTVREFNNGEKCYGPWSNIMSLPEAGVLQISSVSATNATAGKDVSGGYVGDRMVWNTTVSGGSGSYTFRYALVGLNGGGYILLKDFSEGYTSLPVGQTSLTVQYSLTLTSDMIDLITNQSYAMQIEVMDSSGNSVVHQASADTYAEMNFCAPVPVSQMVNVTLRAGETLELTHGVYAEAGDVVLMDVSNPTGAISLEGNKVTALSSGYATILVTPERYKNDVLIVYNITVGYATLAINSITPSATTIKNYETLSWDITFTGGRPDYSVSIKVYCGTTLVADNSKTTSNNGLLSVNYQPTIAGDYTLEVTIVTADSQAATLRSAVTTVEEYNPVALKVDKTSAEAYTNVTWTTEYTGAHTVLRKDYTLYCDGVVVASSIGTNEDSFTFAPTTTGSHVMTVTIYEDNGNRFTATAPTVNVTPGAPITMNATAKVTAAKVALRKGPSTSYGIHFRIDKGKTVNCLHMEDGWYYVEYNGTKGWMMAAYLQIQ